MALDLSLNVTQSNDATYLTVTDTTGEYDAVDNTGGWGATEITAEVDSIVIQSDTSLDVNHLLLSVTLRDKNDTTTSYDDIDLLALAIEDEDVVSSFSSISELVWKVDASDLVYNSSPMGISSDRLDDGIYTIVYKLVKADDESTSIGSVTTKFLVDGDVRIDVYSALREISRQYDDNINDESREIMETLLKYSYLLSLNSSATISEEDDIINMLWTLNKLNNDGSKYSW